MYTGKNMMNKLITLPNKELRKNSKRVGYADKKISKLISDMEETTLDWEDNREHEVGVALAAVQINVHKKVVIIRRDFDNKNNRSFDVYINPEISSYEGEIVKDFEGCLSVKDVYGKVPRYSRVKIKAKDINNKDVKLTAEGFLARVFQHEIDHTNGVLFVDKIKDDPDAFFTLKDSGKIEGLNDVERDKIFSILW